MTARRSRHAPAALVAAAAWMAVIALPCSAVVIATSASTAGTPAPASATKAPAPRAGAAPRPRSTATANRPRAAGAPGARRPAAKPAAAPLPAKEAQAAAFEVRGYEDAGAYTRAAAALRALRPRVKPDLDLDIALALDEARAGQIDSAAALLWSRRMTSGLADTLPLKRRGAYTWNRHLDWLDGAFTGWTWYIARARAEIAAEQGRWSEALTWARACVDARPASGRELLVLAVCAGRAGALDEAARAAEDAVAWDPTLPEAHYLAGLYAWRDGRRNAAQKSFRAAIELDSTYRAPALATVRSRLPSAPPDTLPVTFFTGIREVALLTSPDLPKFEEFVQADTPPAVLRQGEIAIEDSLVAGWNPVDITLPVLVDRRGRIALFELPWFEPGTIPQPILAAILAALPQWRYQPAVRLGVPIAVWTPVQLKFKP